MFLGRYPQTLDPKNRLVLPSSFRKPFLSGEETRVLNITIGREGTGPFLEIYPSRVFDAKAKHLVALSAHSLDARRRREKFLSETHECDLDAQWRLLIPARLIQAAGLSREVWVLGVGDTIKLYAPEVLREVDRKDEEDKERLNQVDFMQIPHRETPPGE